MAPLGNFSGAAAAARGIERCASSASLPKAAASIASIQTQRRAPFSSDGESNADDVDDHHFGVWKPNRTTAIFQRMEEKCPDAMKAYARCVINRQNSGALVRDACEDQFLAVMDCFRSVR